MTEVNLSNDAEATIENWNTNNCFKYQILKHTSYCLHFVYLLSRLMELSLAGDLDLSDFLYILFINVTF